MTALTHLTAPSSPPPSRRRGVRRRGRASASGIASRPSTTGARVLAGRHDGALSAARRRRQAQRPASNSRPRRGALAMSDVVVTRAWPPPPRLEDPSKRWLPQTTMGDDQPRSRTPASSCSVKDEHGRVAMGSSTENSAYGPTHNPWDLFPDPGRILGGSSAAVSAFQAPLGIGTDTGGSIRQPAAVTGIVGHSDYGGVSRYGLIAFSSSLDQPARRPRCSSGPLHEVIAGHDECDSTSIAAPVPPWWRRPATAHRRLEGTRVGVVRELGGEGYPGRGARRVRGGRRDAARPGRHDRRGELPELPVAAACLLPHPPEQCSSNLARFDSVRYGSGRRRRRPSLEDVMCSPAEGRFGPEVKPDHDRAPTPVLGLYEAYYGRRAKVRHADQSRLRGAFRAGRLLVSPPRLVPWHRRRIDARWRCTSTTCARYRRPSRAPRRSGAVRAGSVPYPPALPVGLQIMGAGRSPTHRCYGWARRRVGH